MPDPARGSSCGKEFMYLHVHVSSFHKGADAWFPFLPWRGLLVPSQVKSKTLPAVGSWCLLRATGCERLILRDYYRGSHKSSGHPAGSKLWEPEMHPQNLCFTKKGIGKGETVLTKFVFLSSFFFFFKGWYYRLSSKSECHGFPPNSRRIHTVRCEECE